MLDDLNLIAPRSQTELRSLLGSFLFSADDVFKKIGVLSGGERNRYALARMLLHPSNFLLLDEPTNHLDLRAKDVLLESLQKFTGTCVFVSHDRYFIDRLATRVFEVADGAVNIFPGNYEDYLWRKQNGAQAMEDSLRASMSAAVWCGRSSRRSQAVAEPVSEPKRRVNPMKRKQMAERLAKVEAEVSQHRGRDRRVRRVARSLCQRRGDATGLSLAGGEAAQPGGFGERMGRTQRGVGRNGISTPETLTILNPTPTARTPPAPQVECCRRASPTWSLATVRYPITCCRNRACRKVECRGSPSNRSRLPDRRSSYLPFPTFEAAAETSLLRLRCAALPEHHGTSRSESFHTCTAATMLSSLKGKRILLLRGVSHAGLQRHIGNFFFHRQGLAVVASETPPPRTNR